MGFRDHKIKPALGVRSTTAVLFSQHTFPNQTLYCLGQKFPVGDNRRHVREMDAYADCTTSIGRILRQSVQDVGVFGSEFLGAASQVAREVSKHRLVEHLAEGDATVDHVYSRATGRKTAMWDSEDAAIEGDDGDDYRWEEPSHDRKKGEGKEYIVKE